MQGVTTIAARPQAPRTTCAAAQPNTEPASPRPATDSFRSQSPLNGPKTAKDALKAALGSLQGDQDWVQKARKALDPGECPENALDPVVRDLISADQLLGEVGKGLEEASALVGQPKLALTAADKALEAHVKAVDQIRDAIRLLQMGSYGRLGESETAALVALQHAESSALRTQARIVVAEDRLEP